MPAGDGILCLGPNWGRHDAQLGNSGSTGSVTTSLDLTSIPRPTPAAAMAVPGETWYIQSWHSDGAECKFTDAGAVTFQERVEVRTVEAGLEFRHRGPLPAGRKAQS